MDPTWSNIEHVPFGSLWGKWCLENLPPPPLLWCNAAFPWRHPWSRASRVAHSWHDQSGRTHKLSRVWPITRPYSHSCTSFVWLYFKRELSFTSIFVGVISFPSLQGLLYLLNKARNVAPQLCQAALVICCVSCRPNACSSQPGRCPFPQPGHPTTLESHGHLQCSLLQWSTPVDDMPPLVHAAVLASAKVRAHLGVGHSPIWDTLHECIVYLPFKKNLSSWANNTTILCICNIHSYLWLKKSKIPPQLPRNQTTYQRFLSGHCFSHQFFPKSSLSWPHFSNRARSSPGSWRGWQIHGDCFVFGEQKWKKTYGKLEEFESQVGSSFQDGR